MEKAEPAVVAATPATGGDMPPKKLALARQLDFTPMFGHSAAALPAERQTQPLQTHQSSPLLHPVSQSQTCLVPQAVASAAVQRPAHPVSRLALSTASVVMLESPRPQRQAKLEGKDGTPKKPKQCNCKNSKCLKLYCECFATGVYCDGCNCTNCHNNLEHEAARQEAIGATLERNPNAFRPKINSSPHGTRHGREQAGQPSLVGKHNKGCNCKKSGCLKKYCECFQANIMCSDNCKCVDCKNKEGSEERQALLYGSNYNTMIFAQQAANAAISGAIGSSGYGTSPASKKRKSREILFGTAVNYHSFYHAPHPVQEKLEKSTQPASMLPDAISRDTKAVAGSSRIMYRSPLTNVIQPHDVKDLCSLLVVLSEKAKKALTATDTGADMAGIKSSADNASKVRVSVEQDPESQTAAPSNNTMEVLADTTNCSGSHGSDMHSKDRPASPGTLALMCDEEDTVLSEGEASNQGHIGAPRLPNGQHCTELYAEQEKLVLTKFRDYLNRLITCGSIKETMAKEGNKAQEGTKSNTVMGVNGTTSRTKNGVHLPNSVMKPRIPVTNQDSQRVPKTKPASNNGLQPKAEFFIQNDILKPKAEGAV